MIDGSGATNQRGVSRHTDPDGSRGGEGTGAGAATRTGARTRTNHHRHGGGAASEPDRHRAADSTRQCGRRAAALSVRSDGIEKEHYRAIFLSVPCRVHAARRVYATTRRAVARGLPSVGKSRRSGAGTHGPHAAGSDPDGARSGDRRASAGDLGRAADFRGG